MLKRTFQTLAVIVTFWVTFASAGSASLFYSDGPWSGKVIDSETKEPIEGAVVLTVWRKVYATPAGDNSYFLDAIEVLTNKEGKFIIPKFRAVNIIPIIRRFEGPDFTIFKPGYTAFSSIEYVGWIYFNKYFPDSPLRKDRDTLVGFFKKGVVVELLKLKTRDERLRNIPGDPADVGPKKLPLFYNLIDEEEKSIGLEGKIRR